MKEKIIVILLIDFSLMLEAAMLRFNIDQLQK